ncbi:MAG: PorT family protein [Crocinitomicaceae bacterium]|nr:PorT family protein [Crocinitomicaceae bacterium]
MKKLIISLISIAIIAFTGHSQLLEIRGYSGINIHQFTNTDNRQFVENAIYSRSFSGRPGLQIGGAVTLGKRFYFQPGLQFTTISMAYVTDNTVDGEELISNSRLNMISVPLRAGFKLINPEFTSFFNVRIFGGIQGNRPVSVNHARESTISENITIEDYNQVFFNADLGVGADIFFLFADLGYQFGLTPVHSGPNDAKVQAFYANVGVNFKF